MKDLSDILSLSSKEYDQMESDHAKTPNKVFNIDPKNLTAVPCVKDVVDRSNHSWHHRKSNLEKSVPIHSSIVLSS